TPATNPAIVMAELLEKARKAVAATQWVAIGRTTQPMALRPATQPVVAMALPTTLPATRPAVVMGQNKPLLPRPPTQHLKPEDEGLTDQEIGDAIQRGANFLLTQFNNGHLSGDGFRGDTGLNALCVYALLQCGQAVPDERLNGRAKGMKAMLDQLRASRMEGYETYGRAIRASALAVYNRAEDRDCLKADVTWLINASKNG